MFAFAPLPAAQKAAEAVAASETLASGASLGKTVHQLADEEGKQKQLNRTLQALC